MMKVVLLNGSPHKDGCTYTALSEAARVLEDQGIDTEILQLGTRPVRGCIACGACSKTGRCTFDDDVANLWIDKIKEADGLIAGSPVYYAGPNGAFCAVLDRIFYAAGSAFRFKPAAAVLSARRGGASASFDRLNKYFTIAEMPVVASQYWNAVHGNTPQEVKQDREGLQIMRTLGRNMAWMLKAVEQQRNADGVPEREPWTPTNFIR